MRVCESVSHASCASFASRASFASLVNFDQMQVVIMDLHGVNNFVNAPQFNLLQRCVFQTINYKLFKDAVKSILCITKGSNSAHNIAQILHLSNFFELKRLVYIHSQA